jgi:alkylhydroperoxidase/carboxymuconolactone decarboxylase family protein YurZ
MHKVSGLIKAILATRIIATLAAVSGIAQAQTYQRAYRLTDSQVEQIIHSVERNAKAFRSSLDHSLDRSRLDGSNREDNINDFIKDFEEATKQLHDRFDSHQSVAADVQNVLDRGARIDQFMRRNALDQRTQRDWTATRTDLESLANAYAVTWMWPGTYPMPGARREPARINDRQVERLLRRTENDTEDFRQSLDRALDRSRLDGTNREDNINQFVSDFKEMTKQLRDRFDGHTSVTADVESVLTRAQRINDFMRRHQLDRNSQRDWAKVRNGLDQLARAYSVGWSWMDRT